MESDPRKETRQGTKGLGPRESPNSCYEETGGRKGHKEERLVRGDQRRIRVGHQ